MKKIMKIPNEARIVHLILDTVTKPIYDCVKAAVDGMESRITTRLLRLIPDAPKYVPQPVPHQVSALRVDMRAAKPLAKTIFGQLAPGSVFRLWAGSQPLLKLEEANQQWMTPMYAYANAFYLKTGSTVKLLPNKEVVPLKSTITIDDEEK